MDVVFIPITYIFVQYFIPPIFRKNRQISYIEYFQQSISDEMSIPTLTNKLYGRYNRYVILFATLFIMSTMYVFLIGSVWASNKVRFNIVNSDSSYVVVNILGDDLILCNTEEVKKKEIKDVKVINYTALDTFSLNPYFLDRSNISNVNPEKDKVKKQKINTQSDSIQNE